MIANVQQKNVEAKLYINPVSADFLVAYDTNKLWKKVELFKKKLVEIGGSAWDFCHLHAVTANRDNFIDPSHFKVHVGRRITDIVGGKPGANHDRFGVLLTKENIDNELKKQRQEYESWIERNRDIYNLMLEGRQKPNKKTFARKAIQIIGR